MCIDERATTVIHLALHPMRKAVYMGPYDDGFCSWEARACWPFSCFAVLFEKRGMARVFDVLWVTILVRA